MKILTAYFSRAGMNYAAGNIIELPVGNTEAAAKIIAELTGCGLYKIDRAEPYAFDYRECVAQAKEEFSQNIRPALRESAPDVSEYDAVILGYPNWCGTMPMPVWTFLESGDFKGKKIALLATNLGHDPDVRRVMEAAVNDFKALGAEVMTVDIPELRVSDLIKNNDVQRWEQSISLDNYLKELGKAAPVKNTKEYVTTGLITPSVARDMAAKAAEVNPADNPEYKARLAKNARLHDFVVKYMADNNIDAFLYPLQSILVVQTNDKRGQAERNGLMASVTGLPAITLPGGFSSVTPTAPEGVPVGVELMGAPFSEELLIGMGYAYEQATKHRKAPVAFPDLDFSSVSVD